MWFRRQKPKPKVLPQQTIPLDVGGVRVKPSSRARRISLRMDPKTGEVVFTWPLKYRVSLEKALNFVETHRRWIDDQRHNAQGNIPFASGTVLPVAGRTYTIERREGRGLTRFEGDLLIVHGRPEHTARRVRDFLKAEALQRLTELTDQKVSALKLPRKSIRILDPRTRWGSCGPDGRIMYSWRILFAPVDVMDYLVAHEVAHRVHLNHSRRFWAVCASLTENAAQSRRWLRKEGRQLLRYG